MDDMIRVIVLTKSKKYKGYCVAGIDIDTKEWVRLVSDNEDKHGTLWAWDVQYEDRSFCAPLDAVKIPILRPLPAQHQPENILINNKKRWQFIKSADLRSVLNWRPPDRPENLFGNTLSYLTNEEMAKTSGSLLMVQVRRLVLSHPSESSTKAGFVYNSTVYTNVSVTDPDFFDHLPSKVIEKAVVVMSLPDVPFEKDGKYYKFIAKIYPILQ